MRLSIIGFGVLSVLLGSFGVAVAEEMNFPICESTRVGTDAEPPAQTRRGNSRKLWGKLHDCGRKTSVYRIRMSVLYDVSKEGSVENICYIKTPEDVCSANVYGNYISSLRYAAQPDIIHNLSRTRISFNGNAIKGMILTNKTKKIAKASSAAIESKNKQKLTEVLADIDAALLNKTSPQDQRALLKIKAGVQLALEMDPALVLETLTKSLRLESGEASERNETIRLIVRLSFQADDYIRVEKNLIEVVEDLGGIDNPLVIGTLAAVQLINGHHEPAFVNARQAALLGDSPELHDLYRVAALMLKRDSVQQAQTSLLKTRFPKYEMVTGQINPLDLAAKQMINAFKDVAPVMRMPPRYPTKCARQHRKAENVLVAFDVKPSGATTNVEVISSTNICFNSASVKAAEQWHYTANPTGATRWDVRTNFRYDPPR